MTIGRWVWLLWGTALCVAAPLFFVLRKAGEGAHTISEFTGFGLSWPAMWPISGAVCAIASVFILGQTVRLLRRERYPEAALVSAAAPVVFSVTILGAMLPLAPDLWISSHATRVLREHGWTPDVPVGCVGYGEDSLIFLTRGRVTRLNGALAALPWLDQTDHAFLVADSQDFGTIVAYYLNQQPRTVRWSHWPGTNGFNYSTGRHQFVTIEEFHR